jgi:DNA-binding MarR family transcriptional regulator
MPGDFLEELGHLGVTARIKRLSDALTAGIKELYRAEGVDIEPSWHLVFLFLKDRRSATLTEIADSLRLSQPAMTKMIRRMHDRGYLIVARDRADTRKRNVRLSVRARRRLPRFERIWAAGRASIGEILAEDAAFSEGLAAFESRIREKSFDERAAAHLGRRRGWKRRNR